MACGSGDGCSEEPMMAVEARARERLGMVVVCSTGVRWPMWMVQPPVQAPGYLWVTCRSAFRQEIKPGSAGTRRLMGSGPAGQTTCRYSHGYTCR